MRSRYSAYAIADVGYLKATWHPEFRPPEPTLDRRIRWLGLEILACERHSQNATVEFEARLLAAGKVSAIHEKSAFVRQQGRWLYTEGIRLQPGFEPWKPGRNAACPCGSGSKFKRCCAGI